MTKKSDRQLGMGRAISRRDFVQGSSVALVAAMSARLGAASPGAGDNMATVLAPEDYPPTRTGMRGSHPGSYEVAHALARQGAQFDDAVDTGEHYDVVIISEAFTGISAIERHRKVYALFPEMGGALHAMKLTTRTPAEVA